MHKKNLPLKLTTKFICILFGILIYLNDGAQIAEAAADMSNVKIDYGHSENFSRQDMDSAIEIIKETFSHWDGCELHSIRYTDDDYCNTPENVAWMNELAEGRGIDEKFTQCIAFFSDFHSPKVDNHKTTFNIDSEYSDWTWYLARSDGGSWQLMTFGY